jgi:hypothetical protein
MNSLDLESARGYAKKYNLSVSANDIGWVNEGWPISKKYPKLVLEIDKDKELSKLKQNLFIKEMCEKFFIDKTDANLCSF